MKTNSTKRIIEKMTRGHYVADIDNRADYKTDPLYAKIPANFGGGDTVNPFEMYKVIELWVDVLEEAGYEPWTPEFDLAPYNEGVSDVRTRTEFDLDEYFHRDGLAFDRKFQNLERYAEKGSIDSRLEERSIARNLERVAKAAKEALAAAKPEEEQSPIEFVKVAATDEPAWFVQA